MKSLPLLASLILLLSCGQTPVRKIASEADLSEEVIPPDEEAAIEELLSLVKKGYANSRPDVNGTGRMIHHKEHGCVKGMFEVRKDIPSELKHGVFSEQKSFEAWIRVSNGSGQRKHDSIPDARGLAIKLLGVEGEKLGNESSTQDFLLQSAPHFFAKDAAGYVKFMKASANPGFMGTFEMLKDSDPKGLGILLKSSDQPSNPLTAKYYSALPQRLGPQAMKLHARSCDDVTIPPTKITHRVKKDYLKQTMVQHLKDQDACITLYAQVQKDVVKMPIEDATVVWDEKLSPFVPVATIQIPKQVFTSDKRREFCEVVAFSPWNSIKEHTPLGGLNRARKAVYEKSQLLRHTMNNQRTIEPKSGENYE